MKTLRDGVHKQKSLQWFSMKRHIAQRQQILVDERCTHVHTLTNAQLFMIQK